MPKRSINTERVIKAMFSADHQDEARDLIESECGRNLPFCENITAEGLERIRFAVLKISEGDLDKLCEAIDLARIDWRDLFVAAGFGHDTTEHKRWYNSTIGKKK